MSKNLQRQLYSQLETWLRSFKPKTFKRNFVTKRRFPIKFDFKKKEYIYKN